MCVCPKSSGGAVKLTRPIAAGMIELNAAEVDVGEVYPVAVRWTVGAYAKARKHKINRK